MRRDVAAAFALGLVLGAGAALLVLRATPPPAAVDDSRAADADPAPGPVPSSGLPLAGPSRVGEPAAAGASASGPGTASPSAGPDRPPDVVDAFATLAIVVEVTTAEGVPAEWSGTAYALPAGAPGVDDASEVAHVAVTAKTPQRLPVPAPGRYDVGLVWGGGGLLRQELTVDDGASPRAAFALPKHAAVRLTFAGPWTPDQPHAKYEVGVDLRASGSAAAKAYPGRGERIGQAFAIRAVAPQPAESEPLPVGIAYDASAEISGVTRIEFDNGGSITSTSSEEGAAAVVTPRRVEAGGELRLTARAVTRWIVTVRTDPDPWPSPVLRARFRWDTGWREHSPNEDVDVDFSDAQARGLVPLERGALPGTARLSWVGDGVIAGEIRVEVPEGADRVESEIVVRAAPDAGRALLRLDLSGLAAASVHAVGWSGARASSSPVPPRPHVDDSDPDLVRHWTDGGRVERLDPEWTAVETALVATRDGHVTRPGRPPASGDWKPVFEQGGWIVVVPESSLDESLGAVKVRREDGVPVGHLARFAGDRGWAREAVVEVGELLGPFPPGPVVLRARIGTHDLGPTSLVVRAKGITPWNLRLR